MTATATFAAALIEAHKTGRRADATQLSTPDYAEALEIQRQVQSHLGAVGGFKVAQRPGGPPVIAPICADRTVPSGAAIAVRDQLGIELEIGFELITEPSGDLMARPQDHFRPHIVVELVDTRMTGADDDPLKKFADMQINAGLVVGPALDGWDGSDFGTVTASLRCGETQVIDGKVTVPDGSALESLAVFCAHVGDHCGGLKKGQIVITGSLSGLVYFPGGRDVTGVIEGFGKVTCRLD
ncbi:hydratase [Primorskyibacter sp. 2E233]|uniref:hydratase n=1 Tax=Primorskyibacter sp. 2E233 TaxID=3413431 RepID=UPI003BF00315